MAVPKRFKFKKKKKLLTKNYTYKYIFKNEDYLDEFRKIFTK